MGSGQTGLAASHISACIASAEGWQTYREAASVGFIVAVIGEGPGLTGWTDDLKEPLPPCRGRGARKEQGAWSEQLRRR